MYTKPRPALLASVLLFLPLVGALAQPVDAGGSAHPYFNDQGTLTWYHSFATARGAAEREGKVIFVEYGRRVCTQCKVLCSRILPHPSIRGRMERVAVGLAAECDQPEPAIYRMFKRNLRNARMLPFVAFLTPDGRWITGFAGRTSVSQFSRHLALAERRVAEVQRCVERSRQPTASRPIPTPERPACTPNPCPPCRAPAPPAPTVEEPCPSPAPPIAQADASEFSDFPPCSPETEPRMPPPPAEPCAPVVEREPVLAVGDPDAEEIRHLPAPVIRSKDGAPSRAPEEDPCAVPLPSPQVRPHGRVAPPSAGSGRAVAIAAAARGNWADVIRHTRGGVETDPELRMLNRRAHAWAHERLAAAVRALRTGRYGDARTAVHEVRGAMRGEPEAVDADRGAEALELMQDLQHLASDSPVRSAVRKTAYEKMRGTRWAPLFSDCPTPSRPLSQR